MSDKKNRKWPIHFKPAPREHATLDHWAGKDQHVADGMSTDPMRTPEIRKAGKKTTTGHEPATPS